MATNSVAAGTQKSTEIGQLLQEAKAYRESEASKQIRWVPAPGTVPPTAVEVQAMMEERESREQTKREAAWRASAARKFTEKENVHVRVPAAIHPSVTGAVPDAKFVPAASDKLYSRRSLDNIFSTVCHIVLMRTRVKERVAALLQPTVTARTLAAQQKVPRLTCVELPPASLSDDTPVGVTVPTESRTAMTQLWGSTDRAVFYDAAETRVPLEFKLREYPTVPFQEHPYAASEPMTRLPLLPPGDTAAAAAAASSTESGPSLVPRKLAEFLPPVPSLEAHYPAEDYVPLPAPALPFVPRCLQHTEAPAEGVLPPFRLHDYGHHLPPSTTPCTGSFVATIVADVPQLLLQPRADDELSDDDDDDAGTGLDGAHPSTVAAVPEGCATSGLPHESYDDAEENPDVVSGLDAYERMVANIVSGLNGATLKQF
eukprot:PhM_4_TR7691/c0_g2_i1/m.18628